MQEAGIIAGYHARVEPAKVGLPVMAFILLSARAEKYAAIISSVRSAPELMECHHVSGEEAFVVKAVASSIPHLEKLIEKLSSFGETHTLIVLSSPVVKQTLDLGEK
jgi:Lrp/AsnC family leucine-responsive transcriptional regulator